MPADDPTLIARLQRYLLATWTHSREEIAAPPFVVALHPTDAAPEASVAILATPDLPASPGDAAALARGLDAVRQIFAERKRRARVIFFDALSPELPAALARAGFVASGEEQVLYRTRDSGETPETAVSIPNIPGLTIDMHTSETPLAEVREGWNTNEQGFNPGSTRRATDEEAEALRRELTEARAFLARLDDRPAAAGMFHAPVAGVTELQGISTLEPLRGRGIAAALTERMTQAAFAHGCDLVFLRPEDERAARVYARVGYGRAAIIRAYRERDAADRAYA